MSNAYFKVPQPINEPVKSYKPGSPEREELKKKLAELKSKQIQAPLIIGGEEVRTGITEKMVIPHNHSHVLGVYHKASKKEVDMAVEAALEARKEWAEMPWEAPGILREKPGGAGPPRLVQSQPGEGVSPSQPIIAIVFQVA